MNFEIYMWQLCIQMFYLMLHVYSYASTTLVLSNDRDKMHWKRECNKIGASIVYQVNTILCSMAIIVISNVSCYGCIMKSYGLLAC